jgi:hypothetical protein
MLRERSGLLVERGIDLYGFVHLTFQEYFAACYIATGRGISKVQELIHEYLYSSRWREVFFLAISIANPQEADIILDATLEAHNPFEEYIHSNLIIAGSMLTDLPRVDTVKRENLISSLILQTSSENLDLLRIDIIEKMAEIGKFYKIKNEWIFELLKDPDWRVRDQAVQYFTTVGGDDEGVRERIFELLKDPDWRVRDRAVQYFTTVGGDDEGVRERIFELLKDPNEDVRYRVVQYFTTVGSDDEEVREKFFELLKDPNEDVRYRAVQYFTTVGSDDEEVREKFFELLKDPNKDVRYRAVQYFIMVGSDDEEVRERIFELLKDEKSLMWSDKSIQEIAVDYLSKHAKQESFEKAPILFQSNNKSIKRGAYKLMKSLLGVEY